MPSTLLSTSTPTYIRIVYLQSWAVLSIAQLARPHSPPGTTGGFKGLKLEAALRGTSGTAEEGADNCCISIGASVAPEAQSFWGRSGSERTALLIAHHPSQLLGQFVSSQLVSSTSSFEKGTSFFCYFHIPPSFKNNMEENNPHLHFSFLCS